MVFLVTGDETATVREKKHFCVSQMIRFQTYEKIYPSLTASRHRINRQRE